MANTSILAWPDQDVIAVRVSVPVQVNLRMLRFDNKYFGNQLEPMARDHVVTVQTRNHTAASRLEIHGQRIVLTQEFREVVSAASPRLRLARSAAERPAS